MSNYSERAIRNFEDGKASLADKIWRWAIFDDGTQLLWACAGWQFKSSFIPFVLIRTLEVDRIIVDCHLATAVSLSALLDSLPYSLKRTQLFIWWLVDR